MEAGIGMANVAQPESTSDTMRAIVQDRYGPPDVLELREVDRPRPEDDQVCIRVEAASLNMYDWHMTTGTPYMARATFGPRVPRHPIPGADVAGVVEAVGRNLTRFGPGDAVFGYIGKGAFAEYVCADESLLAGKPDNVTFEQAAAMGLAGITALQGLRDVAGLQPGQRVLVNGASGGVGTFAVQIAKSLDAFVTAVCSTPKTDTARSVGADRVIDYTKEDFVATERDYDVLFDNVGFRPWSETKRVLTSEGINVTITGPKHTWLGPFWRLLFRKAASSFDSRRMTWFTAQANSRDLEYLADLLAAGDMAPVIEATYSLEETADALRYLGAGHASGKLVITT